MQSNSYRPHVKQLIYHFDYEGWLCTDLLKAEQNKNSQFQSKQEAADSKDTGQLPFAIRLSGVYKGLEE